MDRGEERPGGKETRAEMGSADICERERRRNAGDIASGNWEERVKYKKQLDDNAKTRYSVIEIKRGAFVNEKDIVKEAMKTLNRTPFVRQYDMVWPSKKGWCVMYVLLLFLLFPFYVLAEILKNNK